MADEQRRGRNGCFGGCLGILLGMGIAYAMTHALYRSGPWGRLPNGGHVGDDIVVSASYFNAILYGAPVGGLLGRLLGVSQAKVTARDWKRGRSFERE